MAEIKPDIETFAKIKVVGVGGGGGNAVNRMVTEGLRAIEFIAINTDVQALHGNLAGIKIPIGKSVTRGLGAGMNPEMGRRSVEESAAEIRSALTGADMVFLTAGLGGGTGSGAVPEIAKIAREVGALTIAVVTRPFSFEGLQRKHISEESYKELIQHVDAIITIPNDRVLQIIDSKTSFQDAFKIIDDVLRQGVQGIADMITHTGIINVDFADVRTTMQNSGSALMGIGRASGENRAIEAAQRAVSSPLLEVSIDGARGILYTITGSSSLGMEEIQEASKVITSSADDDARIIMGLSHDDSLGDEIRVTVIATGFDQRGSRRSNTTFAGDTVAISPAGRFNSVPVSNLSVPAPVSTPQPVTPPSFNQSNQSPFNVRQLDDSDGLADQPPLSAPDLSPRTPPVSSSNPTSFFNRVIRKAEEPPATSAAADASRHAARPAAPDANRQKPPADDDDWTVPTFIRRKMM